MNLLKFESFLESLATGSNKALVEAIAEGARTCFESDEMVEKDGRLFINPRLLSKAQLSKVNSIMRRKGYDWRGPEDALQLLMKSVDRGYSGDMAEAIRASIAPPKKQDISTKAARHFGTTTDFKEAGYLTTKGSMLDFSGKREGGSAGQRVFDHTDINAVVEIDPNTDKSGSSFAYKLAAMKAGFIRLYPESGGFNLVVPPTKEQLGVLGSWLRYFNDMEKPVEITKPDGTLGFNKMYRAKTHPSVILRDVLGYFSSNHQ